MDGYDVCGDDEAKWAMYAGDPNYNLLNECCLAMNSPNPGGLGYSKINQAAMDFMVLEGQSNILNYPQFYAPHDLYAMYCHTSLITHRGRKRRFCALLEINGGGSGGPSFCDCC